MHSIKTRLQVQLKQKTEEGIERTNGALYTSTWDAICKILAEDGMGGLYAGIGGGLLGVAAMNFAYFYWYSVVRTLHRRFRGLTAPSTLAEFALGAIAGAAAQVCTIPVSVVTTRQQIQRSTHRKGLVGTTREIISSEDGIRGLWAGLKVSFVLVVNPAITYGAYERLRNFLFRGRAQLRPREAFCISSLLLCVDRVSITS
jgi:uncharacterized membrane protein (DUF4010 family)